MLATWHVVEQLVTGVFTAERSDVIGVVVLATIAVIDVCLTDLLMEHGVECSTQ